MLFCTWDYAKFFALVFAVYWAMPWPRARVGLLLGVSLYFYACWNRWLALLIASTSLMDYAVGLGLDASRSPRARKALLALSILANLGLLAVFKYADFFLASFEAALASCGVRAPMPLLRLVLPVGISFYTFEAISYTVDVYRRRIRAERDPTHFLLFITFFPHLVAGPIVRARDFLPQVRRPKRWDWARAELGVGLFLMGLFKKLAIADRMALYADPVFADPGAYGSHAAWVATVAYAIQIYCDFSGYTDMALGSAHLLGYKLAPNFRMPYLAASVGEFWRRWHISLSTWLRDYLFIPLGGSRGGRWTTARNLLMTMTLGGLWHGASGTFLTWGFLHGLLLVVHRGFRAFAASRPMLDRLLKTAGGTALRVGLTFLAVAVLWVVFRSSSFDGSSFDDAATILRRLFVPTGGLPTPLPTGAFWVLLIVVAAAHALGSRPGWRVISTRLPAPALGLGYAAALTLALLLAPDAGSAFIYFQF
ncbi:MAG TPA: MBOAT family O-acyltransferase [Isosphaeraceae bacterium]